MNQAQGCGASDLGLGYGAGSPDLNSAQSGLASRAGAGRLVSLVLVVRLGFALRAFCRFIWSTGPNDRWATTPEAPSDPAFGWPTSPRSPGRKVQTLI